MKTKKYYRIDSFIRYFMLENLTFFTDVNETDTTVQFKTFAHFVQIPKFKSMLDTIAYYHSCRVVEKDTINDYTQFEFKKIYK